MRTFLMVVVVIAGWIFAIVPLAVTGLGLLFLGEDIVHWAKHGHTEPSSILDLFPPDTLANWIGLRSLLEEVPLSVGCLLLGVGIAAAGFRAWSAILDALHRD